VLAGNWEAAVKTAHQNEYGRLPRPVLGAVKILLLITG